MSPAPPSSPGQGDAADEPIPEAYLVGRVGEALAGDPRVGELGLEVTVEAGDEGHEDVRGEVREVVVRGSVSTPVRKAGVAPVAGEVLESLDAGLGVRDETDVPPNGPPEGQEVLG